MKKMAFTRSAAIASGGAAGLGEADDRVQQVQVLHRSAADLSLEGVEHHAVLPLDEGRAEVRAAEDLRPGARHVAPSEGRGVAALDRGSPRPPPPSRRAAPG